MGLQHYHDEEDIEILDQVLIEVADRAREIFANRRMSLNRYSDMTARGDCFRLIRAAVELSPTLPES